MTDDGSYATGANEAAFLTYDKTTKKITAKYNATATTALKLRDTLRAGLGADWDVELDSSAAGDAGNTGAGVITTTALKFSLQYSLAYGSFQGFQFNVDDLLASISPTDPSAAALQALLAGVGGFVDIEGTANLNVTASADLRLDFGIDVSNPCNWLPFLYDTTGITLAAAVRGTNLNFTASVGGLGIFIKDGTATLDRDGDPDTVGEGEDAAFEVSLNAGDDQRYYFREGLTALTSSIAVTLDGAITMDLPMCFPTADFPLGGSDRDNDGDGNPDNNFHIKIDCLDDFLTAVKVTGAPKILVSCIEIKAPDINDLFGQFNACDLITNSPLLLDGLDALLGVIQDGLDSEVLNRDLPLIGKQLSKAANVIGDFREGLLADIRAKLAEVGDPIGLVQQAIWNVLGGPGLDILVDGSGKKITAYEDIDIECTGDTLDFDLHLAKVIDLVDTTANPLGFDIGIPGFSLAVKANVVVEIGFSFDLHFAISAADGFYFVTGGPDDELEIEFKVSVPGLSTTGELFFLQLEVADESDGKDLTGKPRESTMFTGTFSVNIKDPVGSGGKLTVGDILVSGLNEILDADLEASAEVHLDVIVSFDGSAVIPRLITEFDLVWSWEFGGDPDGDLDFGFHNISLDLGAFVSKFLKPILQKIQIVTQPLDPLIKVLTAPLPILSELAERDYTMVDLAERFGLLDPNTRRFLDLVLTIGRLANDLTVNDDGSILVPIGSFNLIVGSNGEIGRDPFDVDLSQVDLSDATTDVDAKAFMGSVEEGGFEFPFLKVSELFKLFLGQPVSLLELRAPKLQFSASIDIQIPIFPPLYVIFGGSISATIDLTFGFDTYGLQKYFSSTDKNLAYILEGFYVKDRDEFGNEITEVLVQGGLTAGAELDILIAEAGVRGGIFADILFDLRDPNDDGRVRLAELAENLKSGPLCIFDVNGSIVAALEAYLEVHTFIFGDIEKTWRFAEITLLEFAATCPEPVLASVNAGTGELLLHIGENAALREHGDVEDGDEQFIVTHISGDPGAILAADRETVEVSFNGITQSFNQVKSVKALAGQGNDTVDLRGVQAKGDIHGGDGNDTLLAGRGELSTFYGDAGTDTITAEEVDDGFDGVADTFYGGSGNDTLTGDEMDDKLYGEDGDDVIYGDDGNDTLEGGNGNDKIFGGLGNDILEGNSGADELEGGDDNDVIFGDDGSVALGNGILDDTDKATGSGGSGDDLIFGGPGNDKLIGGAGDDTIEGEAGRDTILGDEGAVTSPLVIEDIVGTGNDVLAGGGGEDTIFGAGGGDSLFGGAYLSSGATEIVEADGADFLDGGDDNDDVYADDAHSEQATTFAGASIGDLVWFDVNADGLLDEGENGLAGVTVKLYKADGTLVATKTSAALGSYRFTGLAEADYYLTFTAPPDHAFSAADQGGEDALDSDADTAGKTATFHLYGGQQDLTRDAALHSTLLRINIDDVTVSEGDLGISNAVFTVTLNAPRSHVVTVGYRTEAGGGSTGAQRVSDYSSVEYTLVFEPGVTVQEIVVPIKGDVTDEPNETFTVRLYDAFEYLDEVTLTDDSATGTIVDDDAAPVITVADASVVELDSADLDVELLFPVSLSNPSWQGLTIDYFTAQVVNADGTLAFDAAVVATDYEDTYDLKPASLTLAAGATTGTIKVKIKGDNLDEYDERFSLAIRLNAAIASTAATIGDDVATGTILDDNTATSEETDDDPLPFVFLDDGDGNLKQTIKIVAEGHAGNTVVEFTLKLNAVSGRPVTVDWNTSAGTAVSSPDDQADFNDKFETITFAAGETEKIITIEVVGDTRVEDADPRDTDNDPERFFANLLRAQNGQFGVDISSISPVTYVNHALIEITEDDAGADAGPWYVQFSSAAYTVNESEDVATITLVRAGGSSQPVAVYWSVGGSALGQAKPDVDYAGYREGTNKNRGLVHFGEGETIQTFDIEILPDTIFEGDETLDLYLANPTGGPVRGEIDHAVLTILEDDPLPKVSINDVTITEPAAGLATATFTLTVTGQSEVPFVVNWATGNGPAVEPLTVVLITSGGSITLAVSGTAISISGEDGAIAGDDYRAASGAITVPAFSGTWTDSATIKVKVAADALVENTEEFVVKLTLADPALAELSDYQGVATIEDVDTATLTGRVFFDMDGDGFFDEDEDYGLANLDVQLAEEATLLATDATDANGYYTFSQPVGDYTLTVLTSDPDFPVDASATAGGNPLSFSFTTTALAAPDIGLTVSVSGTLPSAEIGNGSSFSNDTAYGGAGNDLVNGGSGDDWLVGDHWLGPGCACDGDAYDATLTEELGADNLRSRIYVNPSTITANKTISGHVWQETGADNQDLSGEAGLANIQVNLFDESWSLIATTYTDVSGNYSFTKLTPCKYTVQFLAPAGHAFVLPNQGTGIFRDNTDSDPAVDTGLTDLYDLTGPVILLAAPQVDAGLSLLAAGSNGLWSLQFSHVTYSVRETDGYATITVTRTPDSFQAVGVYFTKDGTATLDADYSEARGTMRFGDGENEKSFVVPVFTDSDDTEGYETVLLSLKNPTGGDVTGNLPTSLLLIFDNPCPADDTVIGFDGNDLLLGDFGYFQANAAVLLGGMGNDSLFGDDGDDTIYGEGGNDLLEGGAGNDALDGGGENDDYRFDGDVAQGADVITEVSSPFGGNDTADLSLTSSRAISLDLSNGALQNVTSRTDGTTTTVLLSLTIPADVIENITGGSLGDTLTGNSLNNILIGSTGADTLEGKGGDDDLDGGKGSDTYRFVANTPLGHDDLFEPANSDTDLIDFSGTTKDVSLDLGLNTSQTVNASLSLAISTASSGVTATKFGTTLVLFNPFTGAVVNSTSSSGIENLYGGTGDDQLTGNARDNVIWGREGDDDLDGGSAGYDVLKEERAGDWNLVEFDATTGQLILGAEINTFTLGTFAEISLVGDDSPNTLDASSFGGLVRLEGRGGDDELIGGSGTNYLTGGPGKDQINGSLGIDTLIDAGDGSITLTDGGLTIGGESDTFIGTIEFAELTGGAGNDVIDASAFTGTVKLDGAGGADTLTGTAGADTLTGGAGDDTLRGGLGDDLYDFDADSLLYDNTVATSIGDVIDDAGGVDTLNFTATTTLGVTLALDSTKQQTINENLVLTLKDSNGNSTADEIENLQGGQQDDVLIGNSLANTIEGSEGSDTITGHGGADILTGGDGLNLSGVEFSDRLIESTNAVSAALTDTAFTPDGDTLAGFETATLLGGAAGNRMDATGFSGSVTLLGGAGNDVLIGGAADDFLTGGSDDDTVRGGAGDDTYFFDTDTRIGRDQIEEESGNGTDTLNFSATTGFAVTLQLATSLGVAQTINANLTLTFFDSNANGQGDEIENAIGGALADQLTGNALANTLTGNDGGDTLTGAGGDDLLIGGAGDDFYKFSVGALSSLGSDTILEDVGADAGDTLDFTGSTVGVTADLGQGASQPIVAGKLTLILVRPHALENFIGGSGADKAAGNSLDNRFEGRGGDDEFAGGMGNDTYAWGTGAALGNDKLGTDPLDRDGDGATDGLVDETADKETGLDTLDLTSASTGVTVALDSSALQLVNASISLTLNSSSSFENILGGTGDDSLTGNALANTLDGGAGADKLYGKDGDDVLRGGAGNDTEIKGNRGNDILEGGAGDDTMEGGLGNDSYVFVVDSALGSDRVTELLNEGSDSINFSGTGTFNLKVSLDSAAAQPVHATNLTLTLNATDRFENLFGGAGDDDLTGNALDNTLGGGAGKDTLHGLAGNDLLDGGAGDDRYEFGTKWGTDTIVEASGAGTGTDTADFRAVPTALTVDLNSTLAITTSDGVETHTVSHAGTNIEIILSGAGSDTFNVTASALTAYTLNAAGGTNLLNYDSPGVSASNLAGVISATGFQPVAHSGFGTVNLTNPPPPVALAANEGMPGTGRDVGRLRPFWMASAANKIWGWSPLAIADASEDDGLAPQISNLKLKSTPLLALRRAMVPAKWTGLKS